LFQQGFKEHIFFFKGCFLLFNGQFIQKDLVVSFVKVIKKLKLIVSIFLHSFNFLNVNIRDFLQCDLITLIERKNLLLYRL
jgi:hypothetical protein